LPTEEALLVRKPPRKPRFVKYMERGLILEDKLDTPKSGVNQVSQPAATKTL